MVGLAKLEGVTLEELKKPWLKSPEEATLGTTETADNSATTNPSP